MVRARVLVTLKRSILDPQGRTVERSLRALGHEGVANVRVGKLVELELSGSREEALAQARRVAEELLVNPVIEDYTLELEEEPS